MLARLISVSSANLASAVRLGARPALATIPLRSVGSNSLPCAMPRSVSSMSAAARPRTQTSLLMTQFRAASTSSSKPPADTVAVAPTAHPHRASFDAVNYRGFADIGPFIKRIPVDVYPLVVFVSFVCCLGVFFMVKNMVTDRTLRLKPSIAGQGGPDEE